MILSLSFHKAAYYCVIFLLSIKRKFIRDVKCYPGFMSAELPFESGSVNSTQSIWVRLTKNKSDVHSHDNRVYITGTDSDFHSSKDYQLYSIPQNYLLQQQKQHILSLKKIMTDENIKKLYSDFGGKVLKEDIGHIVHGYWWIFGYANVLDRCCEDNKHKSMKVITKL